MARGGCCSDGGQKKLIRRFGVGAAMAALIILMDPLLPIPNIAA